MDGAYKEVFIKLGIKSDMDFLNIRLSLNLTKNGVSFWDVWIIYTGRMTERSLYVIRGLLCVLSSILPPAFSIVHDIWLIGN